MKIGMETLRVEILVLIFINENIFFVNKNELVVNFIDNYYTNFNNSHNNRIPKVKTNKYYFRIYDSFKKVH